MRPDGLVDEEASAGPVRFQDPTAADGWRTIDTSLVKDADGRVRARAVKAGVTLGSGVGPVVDVAGALSLSLPGVVLPEPVLDGSTALWVDVVAGVDVRVEVLPVGFELLWVVKSRQGAAELLRRWGGSGGLELPTSVSTPASVTTRMDAGRLVLTGPLGAPVGTFGAPVMWEAPSSKAEARGGVVPVEFQLGTAVARSGRVGRAVDVVASAAWLGDPGRRFPVTIDPTYAADYRAPAFDTFVQQGWTTDESANGELKIGNNGAGQVARSYMNFDAGLFKGRSIVYAGLSIMGKYSWSCTAKPWSAYDAGLATTATRWTSQPTIGAKQATSTETKGYSSTCPAGRVSIQPLTAIAQAWSSTSASQVGLMLRADDETDPYGFKRFYSANTAYQPLLSITYNRVGAAPVLPSINSGVYRGVQWAKAKPTFSTVLPADPDGDTMRAEFLVFTNSAAGTGQIASCVTWMASQGSTVSCTLATALPDNTTLWVRQKIWDGRQYTALSGSKQFTVAGSTPNTPTISCPAPHANNTWQETPPGADVTCTITVTGSNTSAPLWVSYTVDGVTKEAAPVQPTAGNPQSFTVSVPRAAGLHRISAHAISPVMTTSTTVNHQFGYGPVTFAAPAANVVTTDKVAVQVNGQPGATGSTLHWQVAGAPVGSSGWKPASTAGLTITHSTGKASGTFDVGALVGEADTLGAKVSARTATSIELRLCFTYGTVSSCGTTSVVRVPHAYGAGFPTSQAGPANIALWTGEVQVSETDAEFNTPGAALSVSRTASSLAGPPQSRNAVFGPGWTAAFDTAESGGLAGAEVIDSTLEDGTITVINAEGDVLVFQAPGTSTRRIGATFAAGTWKAVTEDTKTSGITLQINTASASPTLVFTDEDKITTTFTTVKAATASTEAMFQTASVTDPVTAESTFYEHDTVSVGGVAMSRVKRIHAPTPEGISPCPGNQSLAGCRYLEFTYASGTYTADMPWRLAKVTAFNSGVGKDLAGYTYDASGRLTVATDTLTGLATTYSYTGAGKLATITPPGEKPFTLHYDTGGVRLVKVTRAQPDAIGGTMQLAAIHPVSDLASVTGLPAALTPFSTADEGAGYALPRTASQGFAVFGPDRVLTGAPGPSDWAYASLYLTDAEGYTIHTANTGGGTWQMDANVYDAHDNIVKTWDARTVAAIGAHLAGEGELEGTVAQLASVTTYDPSGAHVLETLSPIRRAMVPTNPSTDGIPVRVKTTTTYDQGNPNPETAETKPWLPTTVKTVVLNGDGGTEYTLGTTITGYAEVDPSDVKSGWDLKLATTVTTDMNGDGIISAGDITHVTRYDARGRVIENRQPGSSGNDAGTRRTTYYIGSGTGACVNATYAGLVCSVGPKVQPPGQTLPVTTTTAYTWAMQPAATVITSGAVTATTTNTYDAAFRLVNTVTSTTGLTGSTPVPATTTTYDSAGRVATTSNSNGTVTNSYDQWGRTVGYSTTGGGVTNASTTTYDALGQISTVADNNGSTSYTYDGTDANGQPEHRGLVTKVAVTTGGKSWTSTGAYDAQGVLVLERLPGGIVKRSSYDTAGELVTHTWNGPVVQPDSSVLADQPWVAWSSRSDAAGRVAAEWMPNGQAGTTGDLGATVIASDRHYKYDPAGRLVAVQDWTGNPVGGAAVPCTLRTYGFDANGNRTSQGSATASSGTCATSAPTTATRAYDVADRPTTGANGSGSYTYDPLGRQTSIPAVDTPEPAGGPATLGYFDDNSVASISQGVTSITFTRDAALRRKTQTTTSAAGTSTLVRHYADGSDNPAWSVNTTGGQTTTARYGELIGGDLGLTITTTSTGTTAQLAVSVPRGDVVSEITLPTNATAPGVGGNAAGLDSWNDYDEYGQPKQVTASSSGGAGGIGYGWLGTKQRATTSLGYILMGARVYNRTTGMFTSPDPEYRGGDTSYGYPNDPINTQDLDGRAWYKRLKKWASSSVVTGRRNARRVGEKTKSIYAQAVTRSKHVASQAKIRAKPYVRCCTGDNGKFGISFGHRRGLWLKSSGFERQATRFHGHFQSHYGGVDLHFKKKSLNCTLWGGQGRGCVWQR